MSCVSIPRLGNCCSQRRAETFLAPGQNPQGSRPSSAPRASPLPPQTHTQPWHFLSAVHAANPALSLPSLRQTLIAETPGQVTDCQVRKGSLFQCHASGVPKFVDPYLKILNTKLQDHKRQV